MGYGGDVHTVRQCVGKEGIGREREREREIERGGGRSRWEGIIDGGYLEFEAGPVRLAPGQADLPN